MERVLADIDADHGDCALQLLGHGVLLVFGAPSQHPIAGGAGARPDHPISRQSLRQSITRSLRRRRSCGTTMPSEAAVLAFTTSSNFVGCSTGRSLGLAPLRILAAIFAAWRYKLARLGPYDSSPPPSACSLHW